MNHSAATVQKQQLVADPTCKCHSDHSEFGCRLTVVVLCCVVLCLQETLTYAALLRLPGSMTRKQKYERVDTVMEALGLVKSQNTIIGEHNMAKVPAVNR